MISVQARAQYAKNAKQLKTMALTASQHPTGKYRGQTQAYWLQKANEYQNMADTGLPSQALQHTLETFQSA